TCPSSSATSTARPARSTPARSRRRPPPRCSTSCAGGPRPSNPSVRADPMEIGIYTFAEATPDAETGRAPSPEERLRRLMEEVELADQVGLDVFGVGEHHRPEYVASAP